MFENFQFVMSPGPFEYFSEKTHSENQYFINEVVMITPFLFSLRRAGACYIIGDFDFGCNVFSWMLWAIEVEVPVFLHIYNGI